MGFAKRLLRGSAFRGPRGVKYSRRPVYITVRGAVSSAPDEPKAGEEESQMAREGSNAG
jgi:hypothetical protein